LALSHATDRPIRLKNSAASVSRRRRGALLALAASLADCPRGTEVTEKLRDLSLEPTSTTPSELTAIMAADRAYWAPIVSAAGFVAQ